VTTRRADRRTIVAAGIASTVAGLLLAASGAAGAAPAPKVTICQATSSTTNPYREISVDQRAIDGVGGQDHGHNVGGIFDFSDPDANSSWGDIIPPFGTFPGFNWTTEGQAIHARGCTAPDVVEPEVCGFDAGLAADDPGCVPPVEPEVCGFDAGLAADDPGCVPPVEPEVCGFDAGLAADDPGCVPPVEPEVCAFDAGLAADDPGCVPPVEPEVCGFDPGLAADDPGCVPPVEPEVCAFDPGLAADDPACAPSVGGSVLEPPDAQPPAAEPTDAPSPAGVARPSVAAEPPPEAVGGVGQAALPRTGQDLGPIAATAVALLLAGVTILARLRVARRPRGAHAR
jgi:hypothetical protein